MQASLNITNADMALINAIKSVIKLHPTAKVKIKLCDDDEPNNELLEAIQQAENGGIETYKTFEEYKKAMNDLRNQTH